MGRSPKWHKIPETARLCVTVDAETLKEVKKMAIDLERPENEILELSLHTMVAKYKTGGVKALNEEIKPEALKKNGKTKNNQEEN